MLRSYKVLPLLFLLASCGSSVSQEEAAADGWNRGEVFTRCLEQMSFSKGSGGGKEMDLENGVPRDKHIKLKRNGDFVIEIPSTDPKEATKTLFGCAGNYKSRTLNFLELNGATQRPRPGESWSY
ncbi:hypothetical protein [Sphingopyxis solisilvae]|uniref:hypothetical protein n=1 Tax=Sphingopyxis solisilvae TaxID=1886788 RepID=UPI001892C800|nr:hypothetical protein [Sphingopyxis solisilvae]